MKRGTFSIIIPALNEEVNIARCLDSIARLELDRERYEVVVVDNGSTDRTVGVALEMGALVLEWSGATISQLRNLGARHSLGEILAFLDADCAVTPDWLSAASRYFGAATVAAFGSPVVVPEGATWVQRAWYNVRGKPGVVADVEWLESANLFVTRDAFLAVGGFDESLATCEDYDLTMRLKAVGRLICDHRVRAVHYREPATLRQFVRKEMWRGQNNYTGLFRRKIPLAEVPSLALPLVSLLINLGSLLYLVMLPLHGGEHHLWVPVTFLSWQLMIMAVSYRKNRSNDLLSILQLMLLLNAYFLARGMVVLRRS